MRKKALPIEEKEKGRNPVLPLRYHVPDGEAHVMPDGKLYVYGSLDVSPRFYCSDRYVVVSTPDMKRWEVSDVAFTADDASHLTAPDVVEGEKIVFPKNSPSLLCAEKFDKDYNKNHPFRRLLNIFPPKNSVKRCLYAPDAICKNGKYYLYFCLSDGIEGVACSPSPNGPFTRPERLNCLGIDPAVFIDDDGKAYYYWGQLVGYGALLSDDMRHIQTGTAKKLIDEERHFFHEGSSMRKRNGIYYYVYACSVRGRPTALGYATSLSPLGPFTYRGVIIDNIDCDGYSWNNHGSIEEFNGNWYVFYHRSSGGNRYMRRLCVEPIFFEPDGTIREVKMTSVGAGEALTSDETISAARACELSGKVMIAPYKGGFALKNVKNGDRALFRYYRFTKKITSVDVAATGSGRIDFLCDEKAFGYVEIRRGKIVSSSLDLPQGEYPLTCLFSKPKNLKVLSLSFS